jgi:tol-pal system protein YbgF
MVPVIRSRGQTRPATLLFALAGLLATPVAAMAAADLTALRPAAMFAPAVAGERIHVAQNQQTAAELLVRIQDLEETIRTLTGRVEGLEFQLAQMQTQLQKMTEDNEFRFQQLEGGTPGKPQAAAPTDGATPSPALPQQQSAAPAVQPPAATTESPATADAPATGDEPMDFGLGDSNDPLLKGGTDQLGNLSGPDAQGPGDNQPLDLSLGGGEISSGDAKAQYAAGYDAMTRGDYQFAADQFQQFIALYPDDPQAADAVNWLGEALIQRGDYTGAAQVLAEGYTKHKGSKREPDILLRLGVALAGAEQNDVACRTFFKLKHDFPNLAPAFQQRLAEETQKAKCPVT